MKTLFSLLLLSCLPLAQAAEYSEFRAAQSNISFVAKQMGVPSEGGFKRISAQIVFDPDKIEQGQARVEIDIASIDTGMAEANAEVATAGWFDTRNYPAARFVSSGLKKLDANRLQVSGKLTIKGKTRDISAPFTYKQQGDAMVLEGALPIKRGDFGIGSGIWAEPDVVAEEVQIRFRLIVGAAQGKPTKKGK